MSKGFTPYSIIINNKQLAPEQITRGRVSFRPSFFFFTTTARTAQVIRLAVRGVVEFAVVGVVLGRSGAFGGQRCRRTGRRRRHLGVAA